MSGPTIKTKLFGKKRDEEKEREKQILVGMEQGFTYNEMGDRLSVSPHTIHSHIKKIYEKLHAKSRREALSTARKKGII